mgnify:CR=1 FL=1
MVSLPSQTSSHLVRVTHSCTPYTDIFLTLNKGKVANCIDDYSKHSPYHLKAHSCKLSEVITVMPIDHTPT